MKKLLFIVSLIVCVSCTNKKGAVKVLEESGYTPTKVGGYSFFGCGEDDFFATKFEALTKDSVKVKSCVCQGLFKGKTIRLF